MLQADGGTRTAAIIGAYTALALATRRLVAAVLSPRAARGLVAAISVGLVDGVPLLDLPYEEDARAEVDMNVVATASGRLAEVQGTGEGATFARNDLDALIDLALHGIDEVSRLQQEALARRALPRGALERPAPVVGSRPGTPGRSASSRAPGGARPRRRRAGRAPDVDFRRG